MKKFVISWIKMSLCIFMLRSFYISFENHAHPVKEIHLPTYQSFCSLPEISDEADIHEIYYSGLSNELLKSKIGYYHLNTVEVNKPSTIEFKDFLCNSDIELTKDILPFTLYEKYSISELLENKYFTSHLYIDKDSIMQILVSTIDIDNDIQCYVIYGGYTHNRLHYEMMSYYYVDKDNPLDRNEMEEHIKKAYRQFIPLLIELNTN